MARLKTDNRTDKARSDSSRPMQAAVPRWSCPGTYLLFSHVVPTNLHSLRYSLQICYGLPITANGGEVEDELARLTAGLSISNK